MKMKEYFKRAHVRPVLRFLRRVGIVVAVILLLDVIGLWVFLFSGGQEYLLGFTEFLTIILLVEGSLIGVAGAFMFVGYSEYRIRRSGSN